MPRISQDEMFERAVTKALRYMPLLWTVESKARKKLREKSCATFTTITKRLKYLTACQFIEWRDVTPEKGCAYREVRISKKNGAEDLLKGRGFFWDLMVEMCETKIEEYDPDDKTRNDPTPADIDTPEKTAAWEKAVHWRKEAFKFRIRGQNADFQRDQRERAERQAKLTRSVKKPIEPD